MTLAGSPSNRFSEAKQSRTVGLNTSAQGHRFQSSNLLWAALYFVISVGVDCGSGSINATLLLPSVCEQCQRNQLEIWVGFMQSKCLWGWVSEPLPYTAEYSVFTLFQMEPVLWLTIWYDFPELQKGLACWRETIYNCEWCLYYFKYSFLGYHYSRCRLINALKMRSGRLPLTKETFKDRSSLDKQQQSSCELSGELLTEEMPLKMFQTKILVPCEVKVSVNGQALMGLLYKNINRKIHV